MAFEGGLLERELQLRLDMDQDGIGFLTCGFLIIYYLFFVKDKYCFCSYCC